MRRGRVLAAVLLILGGVVVGRVLAEDAPPGAPPAPAAKGPEAPLPRQTIDLGHGVAFEMVLVPVGEFDMGSPETEEGRSKDEVLHRVRITKPYWLATTELAQASWESVMGSNPSRSKGPTLPVVDVSWDDCQAFMKRMNEKVPGGGFRLPTEGEWEYACRAGSKTRFCFGDDKERLADYAWYSPNRQKEVHTVGLLKSNAWGLHEMHGNVWEWCEDWYAPYAITPNGAVVDPAGPEGSGVRVLRGGGRGYTVWGVRSALRFWLAPRLRGLDTGFRPARAVVAGAQPSKEGEVPSWAKVAPAQIEAAKKAGVPVAFENSIGMRFVLIPAGTFRMGSPVTEARREDDETPHEVTLTRPYYLGVTEVTNGQYRRFRADHDSGAGPYEGLSFNGDDQPVVNVSWEDATAFVGWLDPQERGRTYRLPTEAEWERACRAGTTTPFWWGTAIGTDQANYDGISTYGGGPKGVYRQTTVRVGTLPASPWGLFETQGNVWEWCADWYGDYPSGCVTDPVGPPGGSGRVLRGGSWYGVPWHLRSASRDGNAQYGRGVYYGFRVAVSVAPR